MRASSCASGPVIAYVALRTHHDPSAVKKTTDLYLPLAVIGGPEPLRWYYRESESILKPYFQRG